MKITLQYFDECPNWVALERSVLEIIEGRQDVTVTRQAVRTEEEAVKIQFHGSPTLLIDGIDPFADAKPPVGLACRVFRTPVGLAGTPTADQLRAVILDALG